MSSNAPPTAEVPPESRASRRRQAILQAAKTVFFRNGFIGTSMDEVAALAGVSKQTVYKHFADKETLFSELVIVTVNAASDLVKDNVLGLQGSGDIEADLRDLARRQLALVIQPQVMQLRRMIIGEVKRFPHLGRTFYERGPGRTIAAFATLFEQLVERGELELDDPTLAAEHFNWLIMSIPLNRAMLLGDDESLSAEDLGRYADAGVRVFLAAYRFRGDVRNAEQRRRDPSGVVR